MRITPKYVTANDAICVIIQRVCVGVCFCNRTLYCRIHSSTLRITLYIGRILRTFMWRVQGVSQISCRIQGDLLFSAREFSSEEGSSYFHGESRSSCVFIFYEVKWRKDALVGFSTAVGNCAYDCFVLIFERISRLLLHTSVWNFDKCTYTCLISVPA